MAARPPEATALLTILLFILAVLPMSVVVVAQRRPFCFPSASSFSALQNPLSSFVVANTSTMLIA